MRAESIVFAISGILFGLIVGWILGSQQAGGRGHPPQRPRRPPLPGAAPRRARREHGCRPWHRRGANPNDASRACSSATSISTPSGTTTRSRGTRPRSSSAQGPQRLDRPRRRLLLHEPARSRHRAVRAVADDGRQAHQDPAQHGDRQGLRQAGPQRRRAGVAAGRRDCARTAPKEAAKKALDGLQRRTPPPRPTGGRPCCCAGPVLRVAALFVLAPSVRLLGVGREVALIRQPPAPRTRPAAVKLTHDPVCGTYVVPGKAVEFVRAAATHCSARTRCRGEFASRS